jgi:hypothetical protein
MCDTGCMTTFCKGGRHSAFVSVQCCLVVLKNYCLQDTRSLCGLKAERKSCEA